MILKEKLASQLPEWRERVKKLIKENGDLVRWNADARVADGNVHMRSAVYVRST